MASCLIYPQVNGNNSKLFMELQKITKDRELTKDIYSRISNNEFINDNKEVLSFDENGEPTMSSILKVIDIDSINNKYRKQILEELKAVDNKYEPINYFANELKFVKDDVIKYNTTNPLFNQYVGVIRPNDKGTYNITLDKANKKTKQEAELLEKRAKLITFLNQKLREWGCSTSLLDKCEESCGINGIMDLRNPQRTADGLLKVIRYANGMESEVLPEEVSHLIIEALQDSPQVKSLVNFLLNNQQIVKKLLGEEFDSYKSMYNNNDTKVAKEALGHLLAMEMERQYGISKPNTITSINENENWFKTKLRQLIDLIRRVFGRVNVGSYVNDLNKFNTEVSSVVSNVFNGTINIDTNNINSKDFYYSYSYVKGASQKLSSKISNMSKDMLNNIKTAQNKWQVLGDVKNWKNSLSVNGLSTAIPYDNINEVLNLLYSDPLNNNNVQKSLECINKFVNTINEDLNLFVNGKTLNGNISKGVCFSYIYNKAIYGNDELQKGIENGTINPQETFKLLREFRDYYEMLYSNDIGGTSMMGTLDTIYRVFKQQQRSFFVDLIKDSNKSILDDAFKYATNGKITTFIPNRTLDSNEEQRLFDYLETLEVDLEYEDSEGNKVTKKVSELYKEYHEIPNKFKDMLDEIDYQFKKVYNNEYLGTAKAMMFNFFKPLLEEEYNAMHKVTYDKDGNEIKGVFEHDYLKKNINAKEEDDRLIAELKKKYGNDEEAMDEYLMIKLFQGEDIGWFDRWMNSAADCNALIVRMFDKIIKTQSEKARLQGVKAQEAIIDKAEYFRKKGITEYSFLYKRDENGKKTGKYITKLDGAKCNKKIDQYLIENGIDPSNATEDDRNNAFKDLELSKDETCFTDEYRNLNETQREFVDWFRAYKKSIDKNLYGREYQKDNIICINSNIVERVKNANGAKDKLKSIWKEFTENFIETSADEQINKGENVISDFNGRERKILPQFFTSKKEDEDYNDMSEDAISTLIAYAAKANQYKQLQDVEDALECSMSMLESSYLSPSRSGDKLQYEKQHKEYDSEGNEKDLGLIKRTLHNKAIYGANLTFERLKDVMQMQFYQRYANDSGGFELFGKHISWNKVGETINSVSSLNTIALNALGDLSNVLTGNSLMSEEAFFGMYFNPKDVLVADKEYLKMMPKYIQELGKNVKSSKLALIRELFNVGQDADTDINKEYMRSRFGRVFGTNLAYLGMDMGEHWMSTRTMLALMHNMKMKDKNGKETNLLDALEVVQDGNVYRLKIKDGVTKMDGKEFDIYGEDNSNLSLKCAHINQEMHGIYNRLDKSAMQKLLAGRLAIMYRKWIVPSINKRFKKKKYDFMTKEVEEGYYRTAIAFALNVAKDVRHIKLHWRELNDFERSNIKKALGEIGTCIALSIAIAVLKGLTGGDDDKKQLQDANYWLRMMTYQAYRLRSERLAMTPSPFMVSEGIKIMGSPMAGISTVEGITKFIQTAMMPEKWTDVIQKGKYKDFTKLQKAFFESGICPFARTIIKSLHPEESIAYFE